MRVNRRSSLMSKGPSREKLKPRCGSSNWVEQAPRSASSKSAAASAGAAGVLYILLFPVVNFYMGFIPSIKAFTAAVLGGIGNVPGAFLGAIILGLLESVGPNLFLTGLGIPSPSQLKDAIAFVVLVLILIFRPTGLLGERISKDKA